MSRPRLQNPWVERHLARLGGLLHAPVKLVRRSIEVDFYGIAVLGQPLAVHPSESHGIVTSWNGNTQVATKRRYQDRRLERTIEMSKKQSHESPFVCRHLLGVRHAWLRLPEPSVDAPNSSILDGVERRSG
jgi:hypothetical protein